MPRRYYRTVMLVIESGATEIYKPNVRPFHPSILSSLKNKTVLNTIANRFSSKPA